MSYAIVALILGILGLGTALAVISIYFSHNRKKVAGGEGGGRKIAELEQRISELENDQRIQAETIDTLKTDVDFYKKLLNDKYSE